MSPSREAPGSRFRPGLHYAESHAAMSGQWRMFACLHCFASWHDLSYLIMRSCDSAEYNSFGMVCMLFCQSAHCDAGDACGQRIRWVAEWLQNRTGETVRPGGCCREVRFGRGRRRSRRRRRSSSGVTLFCNVSFLQLITSVFFIGVHRLVLYIRNHATSLKTAREANGDVKRAASQARPKRILNPTALLRQPAAHPAVMIPNNSRGKMTTTSGSSSDRQVQILHLVLTWAPRFVCSRNPHLRD